MTWKNSKTKLMAIMAITIMMAASFVGVITINEDQNDVTETDADAITTAYTILTLLTIDPLFFAKVMTNYILRNTAPIADGGNTEALRASARLLAAQNVTTGLTNTLTAAEQYGIIQGQTAAFTNSYFERMAEIAASELWVQNGTIDVDQILIDSSVQINYAKLLLDNVAVLNSAPIAYIDQLATWTAADSAAYGSMTLSYDWTGGSISASTGQVYAQYGVGTSVTGTNDDRVFIYNPDSTETGFIYVYGGSATITNTDGTTYALEEGKNSLSSLDIPTGLYELQSDRTYVGSLTPSFASDAADLHAAMVMTAGTQTAYALETTDNMVVYSGGTTYSNVTTVDYTVHFNDTTLTTDMTTGLNAISPILSSTNSVYSNTINAATAAWSVFNTAGKSSIFVSPSTLIPNLENMNFTSDQIYLIYMAALQQMSDFYTTASGNFTASDVVISEDSLDLICYGTICDDNGTVVQSNVIFTPICYLRDQAVRVGTVLWNQPGLAMTWTEEDDGSLTASGLTVLETGYTFTVTEIDYKDETYTTAGDGLVLTVTTLTDLPGYVYIVDPTPPVPILTDVALLCEIIVILVGALICGIGVYLKIPILIIIGGIVVVVGYLWGATIVGWFI